MVRYVRNCLAILCTYRYKLYTGTLLKLLLRSILSCSQPGCIFSSLLFCAPNNLCTGTVLKLSLRPILSCSQPGCVFSTANYDELVLHFGGVPHRSVNLLVANSGSRLSKRLSFEQKKNYSTRTGTLYSLRALFGSMSFLFGFGTEFHFSFGSRII